MATYRQIADGLRILGLVDGMDTHGPSAEHDAVYAGGPTCHPDKLGDEIIKALTELNWEFDADIKRWWIRV